MASEATIWVPPHVRAAERVIRARPDLARWFSRIGNMGLSGGMQSMSGVNTGLYGSNTVVIPSTNLTHHWVSDTQVYKDAGSTLAANNDTVQQWNDLVGGTNFTQATAGSRPVFMTGQTNGRAAIHFDTTAKFMDSAFAPANASPMSIFLVYKFVSVSGFRYVFTDNVNGRYLVLDPFSLPNLQFYNGSTTADFNPSNGSFLLQRLNLSTSAPTNQWAVNNGGLTTLSGSSGSGNWTSFALGRSDGSSATADMYVAEIAIYSPIPTGAALTAILAYFQSTYAYW